MSRPAWGAWIEIVHRRAVVYYGRGRAPYGARGLKFNRPPEMLLKLSVAPHTGRVD